MSGILCRPSPTVQARDAALGAPALRAAVAESWQGQGRPSNAGSRGIRVPPEDKHVGRPADPAHERRVQAGQNRQGDADGPEGERAQRGGSAEQLGREREPIRIERRAGGPPRGPRPCMDTSVPRSASS